nr:ATP-binding cassette domain-containing protein [Bacteroidales bacterium]
KIERGEKMAFVGRNGEGKSTLVKAIIGELEGEGKFRLGHQVSIGYFAQNQAQLMDGNKTVFQTVDDVAQGDIRTKVRNILGAFMFGGDAIEKKVKVLSGGERTRLAMIKLLLEPVNVLVLDEPTNHLDINSKEVLKEAIKSFDGTAIIVSHDRDFLDGLVDKVYEFREGGMKEHLGGIYEFLRKKNMDTLQQLEVKKAAASAAPDSLEKKGKKMDYAQRKELNKKIRYAERDLEKVEAKIAKHEARMAELEVLLVDATENIGKLYTEYETIKEEFDKLMIKWEELTEIVEKVKKEE